MATLRELALQKIRKPFGLQVKIEVAVAVAMFFSILVLQLATCGGRLRQFTVRSRVLNDIRGFEAAFFFARDGQWNKNATCASQARLPRLLCDGGDGLRASRFGVI